ncbi:probable chromo domain-containing protein LHP1 isoform X1 [Anneissia japonica]|uniref:probable chromo domain-containing protein LHP1 isoform X1 n=1 Tax=Anneissia japonica TaxID=1529436 RepID=UPI001425B9B4|nr:probable chromo domain-containing protein LHP1 isoform X1 [Anneissia japonica]
MESPINIKEDKDILNGKGEEESLNGIEDEESLNGIEEEIDIVGESEEEDIIEVTDLEQLCGSVGVDIQFPGEYEVEEVLKKRKYKGKIQYLVKWAGFAECTWEPCKNIPQNLRMLKNYSA